MPFYIVSYIPIEQRSNTNEDTYSYLTHSEVLSASQPAMLRIGEATIPYIMTSHYGIRLLIMGASINGIADVMISGRVFGATADGHMRIMQANGLNDIWWSAPLDMDYFILLKTLDNNGIKRDLAYAIDLDRLPKDTD